MEESRESPLEHTEGWGNGLLCFECNSQAKSHFFFFFNLSVIAL